MLINKTLLIMFMNIYFNKMDKISRLGEENLCTYFCKKSNLCELTY